MLGALEVAKFFMSLDPERKYFNKKLIEKNGRMFYEGGARLNKYLHLSQNIYIAMHGERLFPDALYAYANGAVVETVRVQYSVLVDKRIPAGIIPKDIEDFLRKTFVVFNEADIDELIELSHEDAEWGLKHSATSKEGQLMDSMAHVDEYREQYADIIAVLDEMDAA